MALEYHRSLYSLTQTARTMEREVAFLEEPSVGHVVGSFSYASLSLDIGLRPLVARLEANGIRLQDSELDALTLVVVAHEQIHLLQHCATSYGNAVASARIEWIYEHVPEVKQWIQKNRGLFPLPLNDAPHMDDESLYLNFVALSNVSWTGVAWSETDPYSYSMRADAPGGKTPLDLVLRARGWEAPVGETFPTIVTNGLPNRVTNRTLLESAAFTAHKQLASKPSLLDHLGPAADMAFSTALRSGAYLLLERLRNATGLTDLTLLAAADLAMCPPIDASGKALDLALSQWEELYPPWRFKKILGFLDNGSLVSHELTDPNQFFDWADEVSSNLGWPKFSDLPGRVVPSLLDNIIENRMREAWTSPCRRVPIGIDVFRWSSPPDASTPFLPLFIRRDDELRQIRGRDDSENAEISLLVHMLTLFDNFVVGKTVRRHGRYICGPRHFSVPCAASNDSCGLFPGDIPVDCPTAGFFEGVLGCSPNAIRIATSKPE
jgi:hypothetical protein